jgi:hypothetical protein
MMLVPAIEEALMKFEQTLKDSVGQKHYPVLVRASATCCISLTHANQSQACAVLVHLMFFCFCNVFQ